jgi:hypothetical protein
MRAAIFVAMFLAGCVGGDDEGVVQGQVTLIDDSRVPVDGPFVIELRDSLGVEHTVHLTPWPCVATDIARPPAVAVGDTIAVNGAIEPDGAIVPCDDAGHFLRVIAD